MIETSTNKHHPYIKCIYTINESRPDGYIVPLYIINENYKKSYNIEKGAYDLSDEIEYESFSAVGSPSTKHATFEDAKKHIANELKLRAQYLNDTIQDLNLYKK